MFKECFDFLAGLPGLPREGGMKKRRKRYRQRGEQKGVNIGRKGRSFGMLQIFVNKKSTRTQVAERLIPY